MKTIKLFVLALVVSFAAQVNAQTPTAEEIVANYLENIGGEENLKKIEGIKMMAKVSVQGMEIPLEIINLKDGKQYSKAMFQGKEIKQGVFDGETLWSVNFMTMKPEKSDAEATANMKLNMNDFPDSFVDYKAKGYTIELVGNETMDGTETYKVKLVKEPITVDGNQEDDVSYYFFDTESFVPLVVQSEIKSGQAKGMIQEIKMSDYDEVDGLYFPFSMYQGIKDNPNGQTISIDKIELNPTVDAKEFMFPEETATEDGKDKN